MKLSDHFPDMENWTPAENHEQANPQVPTPEVQSSPYLRAPLPLPMQYSPDTLKQYNKPGLSSFRTSPIPPSGYPTINSAAAGVTTIIQGQAGATGAAGSGTGNMTFRGQWNSSTSYAANDVVLDNISSYVAVNANSNSEPDSGSANWNLLGKNLNFRGQWLATTAPSTAVHIQSGQVGGTTGPTSLAFGSNNTAGNTIVVYTTAGHNFASGNPDPGYGFSISDTQGNIYTQVGTASAFNAANGWKDTAVYIAANVKAGANTVTATVVGGSPSPPQTTGLVIAEYAGSPSVYPLTYESQNSISGGTITSISTLVATGQPNQVVLIFSGTTINSGAETVLPSGFTGRQAELYDKTIALASSVNYSLNYTGAASGGIIIGLALTNVGGSSYFPFDTVIYLGSTYVCIKAAASSQVPTNTTYWALLSQGTGGVNPLLADYTATALDDGQLISNSTASTFTVKLPAAPPYLGWWTALQNSDSGTIIVNPNGPNLDGSASNVTLAQNQGILVYTDGANYFTERGFGTITSLPSIFNVNATTGAATLANEVANTVFAGPASGGAAAPTFRTLVPGDFAVTFNRKVISSTSYLTISSDVGKALDVQTSSATTITLQVGASTPAFRRDYGHTTGSGSTLTSGTLTLTANDMALLAIGWNAAGGFSVTSVTDTLGNTWAAVPGTLVTNNSLFSGGTTIQIWQTTITTGGSGTITVHWSGSATGTGFVGTEFSGVSVVDQGTSVAANAVPIGAATTTTIANEVVWSYFLTNNGGQANGAGWTTSFTDSSFNLSEYQIETATGTYTSTTTVAGSQQYLANTATLASPITTPFSGFIQNNGTAVVAVTPSSGLINGVASINLFPGQGVTIATDGTNFTAITWTPAVIAKVDSTAQTANIAATTLFAVVTSGRYEVSSYIVETTAGSVSSTLPNVQIVYTDPETSTAITIDSTPVLGVAGIGQTGALTANTVGTASSGVIVISAKASTNIQYQTVNYASTAAGMAYALHIVLTKL